MKVAPTELEGLLLIEPTVHHDERGFFLETFRAERYLRSAGIDRAFVQDNHARSRRGVLRGLHFQTTRPQGKLVRVARGEIYDVAADVRPQSPTFGRWCGLVLSDTNHRQLFIPPGYAHGYLVLSELADVEYKCTDYYDPAGEAGVIWNDPELAIDWPIAEPLLSPKDRVLPTLADWRKRQ